MNTTISRRHPALLWIIFCLALLACGSINAQENWPTRPIRLLVPYPPGGSTDILTRLLGQKLAQSLGQAVIVENRGGANGGVAASYFVNARPDDHFFMVASLPMMAINQYLYRQLGYDPETDLKPVGLIAQTPNVIVVSPTLKVHTLKELAEYAKAHPNQLAYSSSGVGSTGHLLNEVFKTDAGINLLHVPYKGNAPSMTALIAGRSAVHHRQPAATAAADTQRQTAARRGYIAAALVSAAGCADRQRGWLSEHDDDRVVRPGRAIENFARGNCPHEPRVGGSSAKAGLCRPAARSQLRSDAGNPGGHGCRGSQRTAALEEGHRDVGSQGRLKLRT